MLPQVWTTVSQSHADAYCSVFIAWNKHDSVKKIVIYFQCISVYSVYLFSVFSFSFSVFLGSIADPGEAKWPCPWSCENLSRKVNCPWRCFRFLVSWSPLPKQRNSLNSAFVLRLTSIHWGTRFNMIVSYIFTIFSTLKEYQMILTNLCDTVKSFWFGFYNGGLWEIYFTILNCLEEIRKCVSKLIMQKNILY